MNTYNINDDSYANSQAYQEFLKDNPDEGYLKIRAFAASQAIPISGVNIDEELAEIMKFQHGYNAAAKFITVWDSLVDTIINRLGV